MKGKLVILLVLIASSFIPKTANAISLIKNGKSAYSIVIRENPSKEEIRAANFLKDHLFKISDCNLPIVYSNDTKFQKSILILKSDKILSADGFSIQTSGTNLIIKGGQNKGCIYGVCELLEKFMGVRYYSPQFIIIPKAPNVSLPEINIKDSSLNTYRNVHGEFCNNENYRDFNRLNNITDLFSDNYYVHTFNKFIPWPEYYETQPEYFAFINGKRRIDQLCLSNPDVLQIVIKKIGEDMLRQPNRKVWSVSQNDNFSYCQCDHCKKIIEAEKSASGPIINFVNQVAEKFPDKIISTLAYEYSRKAPEKLKPLKNVQVMLCTIELNRSKSIDTDSTSVSFLNDLNEWGKICNHIYLWDYTVDFDHSYSPFPNLHTLQPNIQLFVRNNVKEHFQQSNTETGHEFSELKSYLIAKLLWNPDADVSKVIEEFTNGFYGPAGIWIRKYIYHLQNEIVKSGELLDIYGPPTNYQNTFLSFNNVKSYNSYFDEAEKSVINNPDFLLHVQIARMSLQYAIMEIGKNDMFGPRGWYKEVGGDFIPNQNMIDILESFHQVSKAGDCKSINESGLTTEEYYHSTKRFINVQVKGNHAFRKKVIANPLPSEKYSGGMLSFLTNGVRGANDYKVHWLGWESKNFSLVLDLENQTEALKIEISTLWDPKSWILHPLSVSCYVSENGIEYKLIEKQTINGDQHIETINHTFAFDTHGLKYRYIKFDINGSLKLFDWHPSAGGGSWVFVDEIVVK